MQSISQLMQKVGCAKWPQRWEELYPQVMADFDARGTVYTDPEYYQQLHDRYGILREHLPVYKQAAVAVGENEDLSRFLALLCRALQDQDRHKEDMKSFSAPSRGDGQPDIAYDMLTALAIASEADMCYAQLERRGLPVDFVEYIMHMPESGVNYYKERHGGRPGYSLLDWNQLAIDVQLFRVGELEFQISTGFVGRAKVYENARGQRVTLAHEMKVHRSGNVLKSKYFEDEEGFRYCQVTETETCWEGYEVNSRGLVTDRLVRLEKNAWKLVLQWHDPIVSIHIPAKCRFTQEAVDDSIRQAKEFLARYFPDYEYKAFSCHSWLLDPQLVDLLGEDSNISKFCLRFQPVTMYSKGDGVLNFVFKADGADVDIATLPEKTRLERALKKHYLSGKAIYEVCGYFF